MSVRVVANVARPPAVRIHVNNREITAYEGESVATALLAAGVLIWSRDDTAHGGAGRPRSPFCNMGVCFDCLVEIAEGASGNAPMRARACLVPVRAGLRITVPSE